jgi:hypothetical protein
MRGARFAIKFNCRDSWLDSGDGLSRRPAERAGGLRVRARRRAPWMAMLQNAAKIGGLLAMQ